MTGRSCPPWSPASHPMREVHRLQGGHGRPAPSPVRARPEEEVLMISRIRRWWHRRRTHRAPADAAVVVILLPHPPGLVGDQHPAARDRPGTDEQRARAALLTALGEHPAPGGDLS